MKCSEIMSSNLAWATTTDDVRRVAAIMADRNVGFLPVCDPDKRVVGVITDRDIALRVATRDRRPGEIAIVDVMTKPVVTCVASSDLAFAADQMEHNQISRIVVVDDEGLLAGVVSLTDLLEHGPKKQALLVARRVLYREQLGPDGGAPKGTHLLDRFDIPESPDDAPQHAESAQEVRGNTLTARTQNAVISGGRGPVREFPG